MLLANISRNVLNLLIVILNLKAGKKADYCCLVVVRGLVLSGREEGVSTENITGAKSGVEGVSTENITGAKSAPPET